MPKNNSLFIIGAGAWGSALAIALSEQYKRIDLYTHSKNQTKWLKKTRQHSACGGVLFNDNIFINNDINDIKLAQDVLIAVPSDVFSLILTTIKPLIKNQKIAWATKGFEHNDNITLSQIFTATLNLPACVISGPSFALEVAQKKPTALVVASKNKDLCNYWSDIIQTPSLRSYKNSDVIGVEIGGLVKNVLAIAAGIADGLGYGANTQAALITRGLNEMINFGLALGAQKETFMGLSGLGDLLLTCSNDLSRNRRFGKLLAQDMNIKDALENIAATVEGLTGVNTVITMAKGLEVEMPICQQVFLITQGKTSAKKAVDYLMSRPANIE